MVSTVPQNALVTVYIPTRNRSELLERAIQSVMQQDYSPVEIIVVDDASEDDTGEVVTVLAARSAPGKHVVYLKQSVPMGACAARNLAINAANGLLITGLDDDDYFHPDRLTRLINSFDSTQCSFLFDGYVLEMYGKDDRITRESVPLLQAARLPELFKRNHVGNQVLTLTSRLRAIGGFDESLPAWQDYDLWIRLVQAYGEGMPSSGFSYVRTVDRSRLQISNDKRKIERAFSRFIEKYPQYKDRNLELWLRLAKAGYGIPSIRLVDLPRLLLQGEPRYILLTLYAYCKERFRA